MINNEGGVLWNLVMKFDTGDASELAQKYRVTLHQLGEYMPIVIEAMVGEIDRLRKGMLWIDHYEPELVASAEKKFGFKLKKPAP